MAGKTPVSLAVDQCSFSTVYLYEKNIGKYWMQYFFRNCVLKIQYFFAKKVLYSIHTNIFFHEGCTILYLSPYRETKNDYNFLDTLN